MRSIYVKANQKVGCPALQLKESNIRILSGTPTDLPLGS
jgi:hypothetical protein